MKQYFKPESLICFTEEAYELLAGSMEGAEVDEGGDAAPRYEPIIDDEPHEEEKSTL